MNVPSNLKYTPNDEWVRIDDNLGFVGVTDYAQEQLSDIVFVEIIVSVGDEISQGDGLATIESVKAAADVYSPVSGTVVEINESLPDAPEGINTSPYDNAWMVKIELSAPEELEALLDAAAYETKISES